MTEKSNMIGLELACGPVLLYVAKKYLNGFFLNIRGAQIIFSQLYLNSNLNYTILYRLYREMYILHEDSWEKD